MCVCGGGGGGGGVCVCVCSDGRMDKVIFAGMIIVFLTCPSSIYVLLYKILGLKKQVYSIQLMSIFSCL